MKRYDISIFLKLFACLAILGLWSFWLTYTTDPVTKRISKLEDKIKFEDIKDSTISNDNTTEEIVETKIEIKKDISNQSVQPRALPLPIENKKSVIKEVKDTKKLNEIAIIPIMKQEIPQEIKKVEKSTTIHTEPLNAVKEVQLRDKSNFEKEKQKLLITELKKESNQENELALDSSWIPLYISKKEGIKTKTNQLIGNLDNLINNIQLVQIVTNSNGKKVAVIRNIENNKVNYLTNGENFFGLKVENINNNEIILTNNSLNKKYTKKLIAGN